LARSMAPVLCNGSSVGSQKQCRWNMRFRLFLRINIRRGEYLTDWWAEPTTSCVQSQTLKNIPYFSDYRLVTYKLSHSGKTFNFNLTAKTHTTQCVGLF
jgi:hypothetical protein